MSKEFERKPTRKSNRYSHTVCSKSLSTKVNIQDACTKLRGTYFSVVNGGIDVTSGNPIIARTIYETTVLPKALYGCELWNTYSKQDSNNLEKAHRFCVKHMQQILKSTSTYFSLSCINLVTIETFINFKKLQLLGQLYRLPCRHL